MKYRIVHDTEYRFSEEVFLEPHYLRFKPKITPYSNLHAFKLNVSLEAAGSKELIDEENNLVHLYWFEGMHEVLNIRAESLITILDHNPFNFLVYPSEFLELPFTYSDKQKELLRPALMASNISEALTEYGQRVLEESAYNTTSFIANLNAKIHADFIVESRLEGIPLAADETFELKKASCRDLSWMLIQLFRKMNIAARFVSGYFFVDSENPSFELHAWVEVYLPGAGWIGLDPSNGIMAGEGHIAIAASAMHEQTMPVSGSIRGKAKSTLSSNLIIEQLVE